MKRFFLPLLLLLATSCISVSNNSAVANFKVGTEINDKLSISKYYYQIVNGVIEENTFTYGLIENVNLYNNKLVNTLSLIPMPRMMNDIGLFDLNIRHKSNGKNIKAENYNTLLSLVESSYAYDYTNNVFLLTNWEGDTIQKIKALNGFFSWKNVNLPSIDIDKSNEYKTANMNSTKYIFQLQYDLLNNQQVFENNQYNKTITIFYLPDNSFIPVKCKIIMKKLKLADQYYFSIINDNSETIVLDNKKYKPSLNMELHTSSNLKLYKLTLDFKLFPLYTSDIYYREKIEILNEYR
jgi:hypothetical protein